MKKPECARAAIPRPRINLVLCGGVVAHIAADDPARTATVATTVVDHADDIPG